MHLVSYILIYIIFNILSLYTNQNYYQTSFRSSADTTSSLFTEVKADFRNSPLKSQIKDYTLLKLNTEAFEKVKSTIGAKLDLVLPFKNAQLEIELNEFSIYTQSYGVYTSESGGKSVSIPKSRHYTGKIKGDPQSLVTINVFENELSGVISSQSYGDINLGQHQSLSSDYILYSHWDEVNPSTFQCLTSDAQKVKGENVYNQVQSELEQRMAKCVAIDFELTNSVYTGKGNSVTSATNWITTVFAHIKNIYLNTPGPEGSLGMDLNLSSVYVWTTADPYSTDAGTALDQFLNRRNANTGGYLTSAQRTGNLAHLIIGSSSNPSGTVGIAYLSVPGPAYCQSYKYGVSKVSYNGGTETTLPTYSSTIGTITHELGHNMGSPHTFDCTEWAGGIPLDNCNSQSGCPAGPATGTGQGTIMSYCHNTVGTTLANGFGAQPAARIKGYYNSSTCLSSSCGTTTVTPTCSDGVQNGTETGVDCGGGCAPCGTNCPGTFNISQGRAAIQSTNFDGVNSYPASASNDGNTSNFNHTNMELQPWWQVDLGSGNTGSVSGIEITHRSGCDPCAGRTKNFKIFVSNTPLTGTTMPTSGQVYEYNNASGLGNGQVLNITGLAGIGRYVRIWVNNGSTANPIHFAEVKVFGCISTVNPCLNNQNPSVSISAASSSYPQGGSFAINATATDPQGNSTVSKVDFYNAGTLIGSDNSSPFSFTVNPASAGSYSITARATDNCDGVSSASSALSMNGTVTCSDGIRNGNEAGVDCGGSSCPTCPVGCATTTMISQGKTASQSTNFDGSNTYPASAANDGNASTFNHTQNELQPWWQVDLGSGNTGTVTRVEITHRSGCTACAGRTKNFKIFVSNTPLTGSTIPTSGQIYEYNNSTGLGDGQVLNITSLLGIGRYIRIWVNNGSTANPIHFAEVKVYGCVSTVDPCLNNQNPSVSISTTSSNYPQNGSFTVNATPTDPQGNNTISKVDFYNSGTLIGTDTDAPYSLTVNPASASTYAITARAVDNCNAQSGASSAINLTGTISCSDGVRNGNEQGVDCGGTATNCPACVAGCTTTTNISQGKAASQSSNFSSSNPYPAFYSTDGSVSTFNHTANELQPWWQVDFGAANVSNVSRVEITHRSGCGACAGRTKNFKIFVSNTPLTGSTIPTSGQIYEYNNATGLGDGQVLNITGLFGLGRYLRIWVNNGSTSSPIHFAEVKVFGCLASGSTSTAASEDLSSIKAEKLSIGLYPNPAKELVNLTFSKSIIEPILYTIVDVSGRVLIQSTVSQGQAINVSTLQPGSYFINVYTDEEKTIKKFVKM